MDARALARIENPVPLPKMEGRDSRLDNGMARRQQGQRKITSHDKIGRAPDWPGLTRFMQINTEERVQAKGKASANLAISRPLTFWPRLASIEVCFVRSRRED